MILDLIMDLNMDWCQTKKKRLFSPNLSETKYVIVFKFFFI